MTNNDKTICINDPKILDAIATALDMYIEMEMDDMHSSRDAFNEITIMIDTLASIRPLAAIEYYQKITEMARSCDAFIDRRF